jgi:acyl CoA:acetate/3-ketoacid CoA transferase alpha subunit
MRPLILVGTGALAGMLLSYIVDNVLLAQEPLRQDQQVDLLAQGDLIRSIVAAGMSDGRYFAWVLNGSAHVTGGGGQIAVCSHPSSGPLQAPTCGPALRLPL